MFIAGIAIFALVYAGFALNKDNLTVYLVLFSLYGIYAAATEGISKAWISNIAPANQTAAAIGTYSGFQSICALVASSLCGFLWFRFGSVFTFGITTLVTICVIIYFAAMNLGPKNTGSHTKE